MNKITTFLKTYSLYGIVIGVFIIGFIIIEFVNNATLEQWFGSDCMRFFGVYEYDIEDNDKDSIEFIWLGFGLGLICLIVDYLYQLYRPRPFMKRYIHACVTVFLTIVLCSFIFELFGNCDHDSFFSDASTSKCNGRDFDSFFNIPNMTLIADFIGLAIGIGVMIFLENFSFYNRIGNFIKRIITFIRP